MREGYRGTGYAGMATQSPQYEPFAWWLTREGIGKVLRERYAMPEELSLRLATLVAADLVSVKGETRAERCAWSEILWKWIDAHEKELGIGRPYLDKDPPHVAPIDGKEYADQRGAAKARLAGLKKPIAPIDGKEYADQRSAAKARLAGLKKPSPSSNPK